MLNVRDELKPYFEDIIEGVTVEFAGIDVHDMTREELLCLVLWKADDDEKKAANEPT
jgi:hypothetical protein